MTARKPAKSKRKPGRPPLDCSPELIATICHRVANGDNLDQISRAKEFPAKDTIYRWLREIPAFSDEYARARLARGDARSDRIDDYVRRMIDGDIDPNVARVAIDAEKWQAAHEQPKRYGDRVLNEHTGKDGGPIQYADMTEDAIMARIRELEAKHRAAEPA